MPVEDGGFTPHAGLCSRFFAWAFSHGMGPYEEFIDPKKRELFGPLTGRVLEIGPGPGTNLRYLSAASEWIGVEPNPHMRPYFDKQAERFGSPAELVAGEAENLPIEDNSVDAVVSSLVLCSVRDLPRALAEVRRVLRPGGRFAFIEHVAAPKGTWRRRVQCLVRPVWSRLGDGCRPDRETWKAMEQAGFSRIELTHFRAPLPLVTPHIAGVAVK